MKRYFAKLASLAMAVLMLAAGAVPALAAEETKPLTSRPDQLVKEEIAAAYSLNTDDQTYHRITGADLETLRGKINRLSLSKGAPPDTDKGGAYGFLVRLTDGTRFSYYVSDSEMFCPDGYFKTNRKDRDELIDLCEKYNNTYAGSPRWLVYMDPANATRFLCEGWDATRAGYLDMDSEDRAAISALDQMLKAITVTADQTVVQTDRTKAPREAVNPLQMTIYFNTEIDYQIVVGDQTLSIWSSDRKTNLHYNLSDKAQVDALRDAMKTQAIRLESYRK